MSAPVTNTTAELKPAVCEAVDALTPRLLEVSHRIHEQPELAFEERESAACLAAAAAEEGLVVERSVYGLETAFASDFGPTESPRVAIVSEYDALPDVGHACGHNVIAAIGLGAALALHRLRDRVGGGVRYLGTPAEERGCGKELMARAGAFEGVDAAMMVHPAGVDAKALRCRCISEVKVAYRGRAAHAAHDPEHGLNALDAVVLAYQAIAALRQHMRAGEYVHGVIDDGGRVPNIVPDHTRANYFVRAATEPELVALKQRVEACFRAGAAATGCDVDIEWSDADYLDMWVNHPLADSYAANAESLGRSPIPYDKSPVASTDMANVSHRVPVLHPLIGMTAPDVALHSHEFARCAGSEAGERAVVDGAKALAMTAVDFLTDEELRRRTREAQEQMTSDGDNT